MEWIHFCSVDDWGCSSGRYRVPFRKTTLVIDRIEYASVSPLAKIDYGCFHNYGSNCILRVLRSHSAFNIEVVQILQQIFFYLVKFLHNAKEKVFWANIFHCWLLNFEIGAIFVGPFLFLIRGYVQISSTVYLSRNTLYTVLYKKILWIF